MKIYRSSVREMVAMAHNRAGSKPFNPKHFDPEYLFAEHVAGEYATFNGGKDFVVFSCAIPEKQFGYKKMKYVLVFALWLR